MRCSLFVRHAVVLALAFVVSVPAFARKPLPTPPTEISATPELRFTEPAPGARLSGPVAIRLTAGAVAQIRSFAFGVEGERLSVWPHPWGDLSFATTNIPNGPATFVARATYSSGVVKEARVDVTVYNPAHQLRTINALLVEPLDGREFVLELTYNLPGLALEMDFGELDSNFSRDKVRVTEREAGVYRVTYPISSNNKVAAGRHVVRVLARNAQGEAVPGEFNVEFRKLPTLPIEVRTCTFSKETQAAFQPLDPRWSEPDVKLDGPAKKVAPRALRSSGPTAIALGSGAKLGLTWLPASGTDALRPSQARLFIKARGYSGYYQCWVPAGDTSASITIELPKPSPLQGGIAPPDPIPTAIEVETAVEYAGYVEAWRAHKLTVVVDSPPLRQSSAPPKNKKQKRRTP